uniref:Putative pentatricopeptide repeat-containing protein At5g52630 n=1 Tax=Anthurium amnicola TaxID=1678845 RepID=A0A1D1Z8E2_9ARAE
MPFFPASQTPLLATPARPLQLPTDPRALCDLLAALTSARSLPSGQQLHAHVVKSGVVPLPILSNHLISFYSKCQLPHLAHRVFLDCRGVAASGPTTATWSCLISSFAQNELPHLALRAFLGMLRSGRLPNDHIFPSATKSCAALSDARLGRAVHSLAVRTGFDSDVFVASSLVDMYAKCAEIGHARRVFDEMPERNIVSWSGMIYGYAQMGLDEEALALFKMVLLRDGLGVAGGDMGSVNDFTYSCVVRVCSSATLLELGRQIHGHCFKTSFDSSSFVGSSLISLYSKCGEVEQAYRVFDDMPVRNLGAWNAMLIACAQHGHTQDAFGYFERMKGTGTKPNFITFLCMLSACSHAGLVEDGKRYFQMMEKEQGIQPGAEHYACMVDLLGRAGKLQEALEFIKQMPLEPTESVWGALLTGCRIHGDTDTAAFAAARLFEMGSTSCGAHMLLSNAYAAAGDYEGAARARKAMRDRGLKKETGLSWVEWGNQVHTFVSGDERHALREEIYAKLEELREEMGRAGYVVDTSFVLRDLDGEEKQRLILCHSERLAIAFALLSLPPERPIKVMKNLRVCGDCHTWIKFVSKCIGRTVILRDNNRFHRFDAGVCSCGDYW